MGRRGYEPAHQADPDGSALGGGDYGRVYGGDLLHQSYDAAGELIGRSFQLIREELQTGQAKLSAGAVQLSGADKMPVKVKMAEAMRAMIKANAIWKVAIYGVSGELIAYGLNRDDGVLLGYTHPFLAYERRSRIVKTGVDLALDDWEISPRPSEEFAQKYPGKMPSAAGTGLSCRRPASSVKPPTPSSPVRSTTARPVPGSTFSPAKA